MPMWGLPVLTWTNRVVTRGSGLLTGPTLVLPRGTPSLFIYFYAQCFSYSVCTQSCCCPQDVPRVALIKSQLLINPFNLFYFL
jgi:hypothetical protein